jgi:hypothetical protein
MSTTGEFNVFEEQEISSAFDAIARLTEVIEVSAARDYDNAGGATAIEILQSLILDPEDSPEGRGNASAARATLAALQAAVGHLAVVLRGL